MADGGAPTGLRDGDILTITVAARALGLREKVARDWLRDLGLVRRKTIAGRIVERVVWGDVVAEWRRGEEVGTPAAPGPAPKRPSATLPRARL